MKSSVKPSSKSKNVSKKSSKLTSWPENAEERKKLYNKYSSGRELLSYQFLEMMIKGEDIFKGITKQVLKRAYNKADDIGNSKTEGLITRKEFPYFLKYLKYFSDLFKSFEKIDEDKNNKLTLEEFIKNRGVLEEKMTKIRAEEVFKQMDKDGGGTISFDEFCNWGLEQPKILNYDNKEFFSIEGNVFEEDDKENNEIDTENNLKTEENEEIKENKTEQNENDEKDFEISLLKEKILELENITNDLTEKLKEKKEIKEEKEEKNFEELENKLKESEKRELELKDQIENIKNELNNQNNNLAKELDNIKTEKEELFKNLNEQKQNNIKLEEDFSVLMKEKEENYQKQISEQLITIENNLKIKHQNEIKFISEEFYHKESELMQKIDDEKKLLSSSNQLNSESIPNESQLELIKKLEDENKLLVDNLNEEKQKNVKLEESFNLLIKEKEEEYQKQTNSQKTEHENEIKSLNQQFSSKESELSVRLNDTICELKKQLETELILKKNLIEENEKIKSDSNNKISEYNVRLSKFESEKKEFEDKIEMLEVINKEINLDESKKRINELEQIKFNDENKIQQSELKIKEFFDKNFSLHNENEVLKKKLKDLEEKIMIKNNIIHDNEILNKKLKELEEKNFKLENDEKLNQNKIIGLEIEINQHKTNFIEKENFYNLKIQKEIENSNILKKNYEEKLDLERKNILKLSENQEKLKKAHNNELIDSEDKQIIIQIKEENEKIRKKNNQLENEINDIKNKYEIELRIRKDSDIDNSKITISDRKIKDEMQDELLTQNKINSDYKVEEREINILRNSVSKMKKITICLSLFIILIPIIVLLRYNCNTK